MRLNLEIVKAVNQVFNRLNILRRWTSFVTEDKYNELSKQALNCITSYMLASYSEHAGKKIHWGRFPKIALYRAFQKAYVYFDVPEKNIDDICEIGNITKKEFNQITKDLIVEATDKKFASFICKPTESYEMRIYRAATKIATLVELVENQSLQKMDDYSVHLYEISKYLEKFSDIPGIDEMKDVDGPVFKVLKKISKLRNQNRWSVMSYTVECSVLGHLFDTAIFSYFAGLERGYKPRVAAKMFFMGIFHDVAEVWTKDIPSPIKDRIPGFRKASEEYELRMIEKYLYRPLPKFLARKIKFVMFEDEENAKFKKLLKGADYLSADSECCRQYRSGSRDKYFSGVIERYQEKLEEGSIVMTPVCKQLHTYFLQYAEGLDLKD